MGGRNANAGRKPKPTIMKLVTGNPGGRKLNMDEPKPTRAIPPCPDDISDAAKSVWARLAPKLDNMGVLTVADALALERMCECYAQILECQKAVDDEGITYWSRSQQGEMLKANPAVAALRGFELLFKGYLAEFGLTPSSRSRVSGDGGGDGGGGDDTFD